jgi:hypothetical protein
MPLPDGYLYYLDPQDTATITGTDPVTNIAVKGSAVPEHQFSDMAHGGLQSGGDYNGHNILVCTGVGGIGQPAFTGPSIASTVCVFRLTEDTPASWTWFVYDGNWSNSPTGLRCATGTGLVSTRPTPSSQNEYTERTGVVAPKGKLLVSIDIRNGADSTVYLYDLEDSGAELGSHVLDLSTTPQPTAGPIRLAASVAAGSLHLQGNIGHVFLYPRALDAQERSDIVSWLVDAWAVETNPPPHSGSHTVDDISQANDPNCIYFGQVPAIQNGDQFSFKETTETNGWGVDIDGQGYPVIDSGGATGTDSFIFSISRDSGSTWEPDSTWTFTIGAPGIVYTLIPNADGTQRTNYPNGDYTPPLNLPAPTMTTASNITQSSMQVAWSYPTSGTDADGFVLQRWIVGTSTSWTSHPATDPTPAVQARTATETGLPSGTTIRFRIAAKSGDVRGAFSEMFDG